MKSVAEKIVSKMMGEFRGLMDNPEKGLSVEALLGISTPYRFLHIEHNYAFKNKGFCFSMGNG